MMNNCDNCDDHNNCVRTVKNALRRPMDRHSLYKNRIYDNQIANRYCYERSPINIVEGFGNSDLTLRNVLKWVIILVIIYLIFMLFTKSETGKSIMKGGSESLSDLSFLRTN